MTRIAGSICLDICATYDKHFDVNFSSIVNTENLYQVCL